VLFCGGCYYLNEDVVFLIEDDAQNGVDHVDAHVALI